MRRRRLGAELRRLREAADLTIERVAGELECSDSKISRIETGQVGATPRDVRDMLALYDVPDEQREKLVKLAREARQRGWWGEYGDVPIADLMGFEAAAVSIRSYQTLLVPGLLQTVDYARAVIRAVSADMPGEEVERRVKFRMARQERLTQGGAPALWTILDEAVLRRPVGGRCVLQEQLDQLMKIGALPTVTLQVLPFAAGEHAGMDGNFTIFGFAEPADVDVVYLENITRELVLEGAEEVSRYRRAFDLLRRAALGPDDSAAFLAALAAELEQPSVEQPASS